MRRGIFLAATLFSLGVGLAAADAGDVGPRRVLLASSGAPSWVLNGNGVPATLDFIFSQGLYYQQGQPGCKSANGCITTLRSSTGYAADTSGNYYQFGNNVPRITNAGLTVEESRTNDALYARDMTQSGSWTAVGIGTAKNAVGIDGTANAATTLTATGTASSCTASCTILQSITLTSQADTYSVFLKRVTGSGAVNITINNLTGTTACTLATTGFTRCSVTATLANPVIGIQMATVGDVIVADVNQMEPGGFATTPIPTTSGAATRSADAVTATHAPVFGSAYTLYASGTPEAPNVVPANEFMLQVDAGSSANRFGMFRTAAAGPVLGVVFSLNSTSGSFAPAGAFNQASFSKAAASGIVGNMIAVLNGVFSTDSSTYFPGSIVNRVAIGYGLTLPFNGTISRAALWATTAQPSGFLQQITSGAGP
jgi:hypothetical protein